MTERRDDPEEPVRGPGADSRSEEDRMHDAVQRYLADERANWGWRWKAQVVEHYGYAGLQGPLRPSATLEERRAWQAERERRQRIDVLVVIGMVLVFVVAVALMASGDDDQADPYGFPEPVTVQVDPNDEDALPTSIPDGHGGTIQFGH